MQSHEKSGSDHASVVDDLTLKEKITLIHGATDPDGTATGFIPGNDRVGIPSLKMVDGPLGVRAMGERATAFPSSIALAASWEPDLAREFGAALGRETASHGQDVLLGPGVNIVRAPTGGRNFEYYSEDPYLTSRLAVETISGIQSEGVASMVKHFVANNQETNRYEVSADVSERALREIYLPAFRAAVERGNVYSVMAAYNCVNGDYMGEHKRLLTDVLKDEWGFDGPVVSDWWGTRSTINAALAGLDIEMPGVTLEEYLPEEAAEEVETDEEDAELPPRPEFPAYFGEPLLDAVEAGEVDESVVDEKVTRLLRLMDGVGCFSDGDCTAEGDLNKDAHRETARTIATAGTVMLTNDGGLPISEADSLAIVGPNADSAKLGGGGSSEVMSFTSTSPLDALTERATSVKFERGVEPVSESSYFADEAVDDAEANASIDAAARVANNADCTVVVVQDDASEFKDRPDMSLPGEQDKLIKTVATEAERTVVVLRTSGPVKMPWLDAVDAVVETWYPGQVDGTALADVLFGDTDPGGRLPVTFGLSSDDYPTGDMEAYPGVDGVASYDEGVFVGYRYFDHLGTEPLFPFGHGLSYATFEYEDVTVSKRESGDDVEVSVELHNTSDRAGTEVVQVYAKKKAAPVAIPERELVGFQSISVEADETVTMTISLDAEDFSYYDEETGWTVANGTNTVSVGRSARDIRAAFDVEI